MHLNLDPQLTDLIEKTVRSGRFSTAEELVAAGVNRVIAEDDVLLNDDDDQLRAETAIGLRDADAGRFVDFTAADIISACREVMDQRRHGENA